MKLSTEEFSSYIFKENEVKTHNKKIIKERTYYIGIFVFLIGVLCYLLEFEYLIPFIFIGYLLMVVGEIILSGRRPSVGHRPLKLKLTKDSIFIGKEKIDIKDKQDVEIRVVGYKGQWINQRIAFYQAHNGNENVMRIRYNNKTAEFNFVLESEFHKDKLIKFCEANGFEID